MPPSPRYGLWLRHLHWLTAALVIVAIALAELHHYTPRGSALRSGAMYAHTQFGLAALLVLLPRLLLRLAGRTPPVEPPLPRWQRAAALLVHVALYALLLALPVLGMLVYQANGRVQDFLGLPLPALIAPDHDLVRPIEVIHIQLGDVLLWLAAAHAASALWHHWGRRDTTLRRMGYGGRGAS